MTEYRKESAVKNNVIFYRTFVFIYLTGMGYFRYYVAVAQRPKFKQNRTKMPLFR